MGLDWVPIRKPMQGHQAEFDEIINYLSKDEDPKLQSLAAMDDDELYERYEEISISPYESLQAPKVGRDPSADDFIKQRYQEQVQDKGFATEFPTVEGFVAHMEGYYVVELMDPTPAVPFYQTTTGELIDFRAKFLNDVEAILGPNLFEEAWEDKVDPADALAYADKLMVRGDGVVEEGQAKQLKALVNLPVETALSSPESMHAHILFSAANWIRFWAERGHGYRADY